MAVERNWLQDYLDSAIERHLCMRIHCTTCGNLDFRTGLRKAIADAVGRPLPLRLDSECAQLLAQAMSSLQPANEKERFEQATRFILYELWEELGDQVFQTKVAAKLSDSWAGGVLDRMRAHHERRKDRG